MSDLVARLALGRTQVEQDLATRHVARVGVGDDRAGGGAMRAVGDRVGDAVGVSEGGLEVEVDGGEASGAGERVAGEGVSSDVSGCLGCRA